MSNGTTCCALEICCNAPQRRKKVTESLAKFTGADVAYCEKVQDWMEHEGLVFAPESFRQVITDIAAMARKHALS